MSEDEILKKGKERKAALEKSRFKQQNLPAWRPNPTFLTTVLTFAIFGGLIFLPLGIFLIFRAKTIKEYELSYEFDCRKEKVCPQTIRLDEAMEAPIYVYYQVDNLYQNHRRYVNSRDDQQLRGVDRSLDDLTTCEPITKNKDIHDELLSYDGSTLLDPEAPASPWGLIARSFFNDTFQLFGNDGNEIDISPKGIAWDTDVSDLFKRAPNAASTQWLDVEDERFIVWMRVAGMPNFRKPYGIIHEDLKDSSEAVYNLVIHNNYNVLPFQGDKKFFMSTTNSYGGRNMFLAIWYLVVGGLCIIFAGIFLVAYVRQKLRAKKES